MFKTRIFDGELWRNRAMAFTRTQLPLAEADQGRLASGFARYQNHGVSEFRERELFGCLRSKEIPDGLFSKKAAKQFSHEGSTDELVFIQTEPNKIMMGQGVLVPVLVKRSYRFMPQIDHGQAFAGGQVAQCPIGPTQ